VIRPTYEDPYTLEYRRLYAAIVSGEEVKTTPLDGESYTPSSAATDIGMSNSQGRSADLYYGHGSHAGSVIRGCIESMFCTRMC
jgi:hypothetical protein